MKRHFAPFRRFGLLADSRHEVRGGPPPSEFRTTRCSGDLKPGAIRRIGKKAAFYALVWMAISVRSASATTCQNVCPGTGSCTISNIRIVEPGSVLDCSGRSITIGSSGSLKVIGGEMSILANNLSLLGIGSTITGIDGSDGEPSAVSVELTGSLVAPRENNFQYAMAGAHLLDDLDRR